METLEILLIWKLFRRTQRVRTQRDLARVVSEERYNYFMGKAFMLCMLLGNFKTKNILDFLFQFGLGYCDYGSSHQNCHSEALSEELGLADRSLHGQEIAA